MQSFSVPIDDRLLLVLIHLFAERRSSRKLREHRGTKRGSGSSPASLSYLVVLTLLLRVCRVWLGLTRARQPPQLLSLAKSGAYSSGSSLSNSQQSCSIFRLPLDAQRHLSK